MKKQLIIGGALAVFGGLYTITTTPVSATKYPANTDMLDSPFVITSIQPSTSKIRVKYNGEKDNFQPLSLINIEAINVGVGATEDQIDESLPSMGQAISYWNYLIYYEQIYSAHPIMDYGQEEKELRESRYQRVIDLDKETLHILYYSVRPGQTSSQRYLYGKIDYSLCMKSAVYKPGVECRAVEKPEGGVWYWPYYDGEKLELPREEWDEWGYSEDGPQPQPIPVPQPIDAKISTNQAQQNNKEVPQVATVTQGVTGSTQTQPESNIIPQSTRETIEVPVSGDTCPTQGFPWWLIILCIILLGAEGIVLYWWFGHRRKN